jgi:hypothetical protein
MRALVILSTLALSACGEGRPATEDEMQAARDYGKRCMSKSFTYESCRTLCNDEFVDGWNWDTPRACISAARAALIERGAQ